MRDPYNNLIMVSTQSTVIACVLVAVTTAFKHFTPYMVDLAKSGTEIPVIGIVTQTLEEEMHNDTRFADYKYYIM